MPGGRRPTGFSRHTILLAASAAGCALACSHTDARSPAPLAKALATQVVARLPADTEIVRGPGVPTDSDDTASTRYGKHPSPRRIASPGCKPQGFALCLQDTATVAFSECCAPDERLTNWLVFAAAQDSMQLFLEPSPDAYLSMLPPSAAGAVAETSRGVDASWMRARFPAAGTYVFTAGIEADTATRYELRIASVIANRASDPIGATATLTLTGPHKAKIAIAPQSMMPARDTMALRRFAVGPGTYRVLLVRDTVYAACRLPCAHHTVFALGAGQSVTIAP